MAFKSRARVRDPPRLDDCFINGEGTSAERGLACFVSLSRVLVRRSCAYPPASLTPRPEESHFTGARAVVGRGSQEVADPISPGEVDAAHDGSYVVVDPVAAVVGLNEAECRARPAHGSELGAART